MKYKILLFTINLFINKLSAIPNIKDSLPRFEGYWLISQKYYQINHGAAWVLTPLEKKKRFNKILIIRKNKVSLPKVFSCNNPLFQVTEQTWWSHLGKPGTKYPNPIPNKSWSQKVIIQDCLCKTQERSSTNPTHLLNEFMFSLILFEDNSLYLEEGNSYFKLEKK